MSRRPRQTSESAPAILFLTGSFFPDALGGTISAFNLARALRSRGASISFLVDPVRGCGQVPKEYDGFSVRCLNLSKPGRLSRLWTLASYIAFLLVRGRLFSHFYVSGPSYRSLFLAYLYKLVAGGLTIVKVTLDGSDSIDALSAGRHGWLAAWLYRRMDAVVTMTSGQEARLKDGGFSGVICTIPNGVDCDRFAPPDEDAKASIRHRLGLPAEAKVLVYAGYLGERKGTDILLAAFHTLSRTRPDLHLICAGNFSPTYQAEHALKDFCRRHGVPPSVVDSPALHRTGRVSNIEHYLGAADIFVFPSRREGFGTVQIEAMACGLPCVVNYLEGITDDIFKDEEDGLIVRHLSAEAFARSIETLLDSPAKRKDIGASARRKAVSHFSLERVADRYLDLIHRLDAALSQ